MRSSRPCRRFIARRVGSPHACFAWLLSLCFVLYVLDNYVLTTQLMLDIVRNERSMTPTPIGGLTSVRISSDNQLLSRVHGSNSSRARNIERNVVDRASGQADKSDEARQRERRPRCMIECPAGQISYHVKSGEGRNVSPLICFDGKYVMGHDGQKGIRGMNVLVINNVMRSVVDLKVFDVYTNDITMVKYLRESVRDGYIVIVATMDDASNELSDEGKRTVQGYGSMLITTLGFRDSFVMIGQKGLEEGRAIEKRLSRKDEQKYPESVEITGCLNAPLGSLTRNIFAIEDAKIFSAADIGKDLPNCGIKESCDNDSFSVQLFTGLKDKTMAKMCIDGKYVFADGLNDGGRGLNMAVVEPTSRTVVRIGHFDTYAQDSSAVEFFLEMLEEKHLIIVVSHDDASKQLNLVAQDLFRLLGSSYSHSLGFRDAWVFVGQQSIEGYSEIEALSPRIKNSWPMPIDKRLCVPATLKGRKTPLPLISKSN